MRKRSFVGRFLVMICIISIVFMAIPAIGQEKYPSRPISLTVGFAPGGGDIVARVYGQGLEKILKQKVVILNQPGAATAIQMSYLKKALPDGYTLGFTGTTALISAHLREATYDFFEDYDHLMQVLEFVGGLCVNTDSPWKTLRELIEYGQKNPGKLKYGTTEAGSPGMLTMEQIALYNNFKWVHIPFTGNTLAAAAVLGKHIDAMWGTPPDWGPLVKSGKLRLLGTKTLKRLKDYPDAPTIAEQGIKYYGHASISGLFGIATPKGLPANIKAILLPALKGAFNDPEYQELLDRYSILPANKEGEEWVRYLRDIDMEAVLTMKNLGMKLMQ